MSRSAFNTKNEHTILFCNPIYYIERLVFNFYERNGDGYTIVQKGNVSATYVKKQYEREKQF